jgi:hypothetical protein
MAQSLDDLVAELAAIGPMFLHKQADGNWSCTVNLPAPEGNEFKCKSGFGHKKPHAAVAACLANVPPGFRPNQFQPFPEEVTWIKTDKATGAAYLADFTEGYETAFLQAGQMLRDRRA